MSDKLIQCREEDLNAIMAEERQKAVREALSPFKSTQVTGYFSTVRFLFESVEAPAGTFTYSCRAAPRRVAFSYAVDDSTMVQAGFEPGKQASLRYTNLSEANKTRDGETYNIEGIALYRGATSDGTLSAYIWDNVAMTLTMNTDSNWPLGSLHFFPSTSGLSGRGFTRVIPPPLAQANTDIQLLSNSVEDAGAYFAFKNPLIWMPSGRTDSSLSMPFTFPTDITLVTVARAAGAGVAAYVPPVYTPNSLPVVGPEIGTYVDITVRLIGNSIRDMSQNK